MPLQNIRCGIINELEEDEKLDTTNVKLIASGDSISARGAYEKKQISFKPVAKVILCSNELPKFDTSDQAMLDRIVYIPFNARFVDTVPKCENEYKADKVFADSFLSGDRLNEFFSWMVQGAKLFYAEGMRDKPNVVLRKIEDSLLETDDLQKYINEQCEVIDYALANKTTRKNYILPIGTLTDDYNRYAHDNGYSILTKTAMNKKIKSKGFIIKRSYGTQVYGIKLKDEENDAPNIPQT